MQNPEKGTTVRITIKVENGDFSYDSSRPIVIVYRNQWIEWKCEPEYAFAVHLGWNSPQDVKKNSPFEKGRYRAEKGGIIKVKVEHDAQYGRYEYFVAVFDEKEIWTDDPDFIIPRRPKGH